MFIHNDKLKAMIDDYKRTGLIGDDLKIAVYTICAGIGNKHPADVDGALDAYEKIVSCNVLQSIDTTKNVHSYITTIIVNCIRSYYRHKGCEQRAIKRLADEINIEKSI